MTADTKRRLQLRFCQLSNGCPIAANKVEAPYCASEGVGVYEVAPRSQGVFDIGGGEIVYGGMRNHWLIDLEGDGDDIILGMQRARSATRDDKARSKVKTYNQQCVRLVFPRIHFGRSDPSGVRVPPFIDVGRSNGLFIA